MLQSEACQRVFRHEGSIFIKWQGSGVEIMNQNNRVMQPFFLGARDRTRPNPCRGDDEIHSPKPKRYPL